MCVAKEGIMAGIQMCTMCLGDYKLITRKKGGSVEVHPSKEALVFLKLMCFQLSPGKWALEEGEVALDPNVRLEFLPPEERRADFQVLVWVKEEPWGQAHFSVRSFFKDFVRNLMR